MIQVQPSTEFANAININAPVVALESTVLTHGLPRPQNLGLAHDMERTVREGGAVPATIGFLDGNLHIGLNAAELERLANEDNVLKVGPRDYAIVIAKKMCGGTTDTGTILACKHAGIKVLATGGIDGDPLSIRWSTLDDFNEFSSSRLYRGDLVKSQSNQRSANRVGHPTDDLSCF